jgi:hypothetical protein
MKIGFPADIAISTEVTTGTNSCRQFRQALVSFYLPAMERGVAEQAAVPRGNIILVTAVDTSPLNQSDWRPPHKLSTC